MFYFYAFKFKLENDGLHTAKRAPRNALKSKPPSRRYEWRLRTFQQKGKIKEDAKKYHIFCSDGRKERIKLSFFPAQKLTNQESWKDRSQWILKNKIKISTF